MLKKQIEEQVKKALKEKDEARLSTLRFLLSFIQNEEIAKRRELTDEEVLSLIQRQIKQHKESIEAFEKGGRAELAEKEKRELEILMSFMPEQLSEEDLRKIVQEVRESLPAADKDNFGKIMGMVMGKVKGRVSGEEASRIVREILGG